jgi:hypothetical protein
VDQGHFAPPYIVAELPRGQPVRQVNH